MLNERRQHQADGDDIRGKRIINCQACKCDGISGNFAQSWEVQERLIQSAQLLPLPLEAIIIMILIIITVFGASNHERYFKLLNQNPGKFSYFEVSLHRELCTT